MSCAVPTSRSCSSWRARIELEDGPAIANAAVRERLADYYVRTQGVRWSRYRTMTALSRGDTPGPENSIGKLVNAPKAQDMASFALDLMDMGGMVTDKDFRPDAGGLPGVAAVLTGQPHRGRHRRDPARTSSPSACWACRRTSASTARRPSTSCRPAGAEARPYRAIQTKATPCPGPRGALGEHSGARRSGRPRDRPISRRWPGSTWTRTRVPSSSVT